MPVEVDVQVRLIAVSAKTEDDVVNTWHFQGVTSPMPTGTSDLIRDALKTFYSSAAPGIPNDWDSSHVSMKFYDLADPKPRAPFRVYDVALTASFASTSKNTPRQVATVMSSAATPVSGVPMARKRGRIYLPCLTDSNYVTGLIPSATVDAFAGYLNTLRSTSSIATDWKWVVRSSLAGSSPVVQVWVDNSPDVIRRRKRDSTYRKTLP